MNFLAITLLYTIQCVIPDAINVSDGLKKAQPTVKQEERVGLLEVVRDREVFHSLETKDKVKVVSTISLLSYTASCLFWKFISINFSVSSWIYSSIYFCISSFFEAIFGISVGFFLLTCGIGVVGALIYFYRDELKEKMMSMSMFQTKKN